MNGATATVWMLVEIAIVVLAVWYVVKTLFFRRPARHAKRGAHVGEALVILLVVGLWTVLCLLVLMGAAFAGASAAVIGGILVIGGGIMLGLLWGAGRHLYQAFGQSGGAPANPSEDRTGNTLATRASSSSTARGD